MSEGRVQPGGESVIFTAPELEGIVCEVQYTIQTGRPFTEEKGLCGAGVVTLPTGQPRVVIQVKHPDGMSLSVSVDKQQLLSLLECIVDASEKADQIALAAAQAKVRPS